MATGECFLCGNYETVERHHLFGGPFRKKADRLKLTVMLCPWCYLAAKDRAHKSAETRLYLHKYGQQKTMREQGWSVEDFVREFGKNYLDEEEIEEVTGETGGSLTGVRTGFGMTGAFRVTEGAELPW